MGMVMLPRLQHPQSGTMYLPTMVGIQPHAVLLHLFKRRFTIPTDHQHKKSNTSQARTLPHDGGGLQSDIEESLTFG